MKFAAFATLALVSVSGTELQNQAHAKGLKAPHPVRLAQDKTKENFGWRDAASMGAAAANDHFNGAQVKEAGWRDSLNAAMNGGAQAHEKGWRDSLNAAVNGGA